MKLKHALIASGVWTVVGVVAAVGLITYIASQRLPRRVAEQRAQTAGGAAGVVVAVGYGAIWLPYAAAVGKRRREEAAARAGATARRRGRE